MPHTHPPRHVTLRGYRAAWLLSEQEAADRVGVSVPVLLAWESGAARPDAAQLISLARAYRLAVEDLLPALGPDPR